MTVSKKTDIIDFHSHILPCADHGSDGIKTSREQVALMNNAGVDTVVLTPHFYPHRHNVETFTAKISAAAEELVAECHTHPRFCVGAEVLYCEGIENMEGLERLCVKGTNTLLLELPMSEVWSRGMLYEIKRLCGRYTVVLAHIDRYVEYHEDELAALISFGAVAQINISALYSKGTMKRLEGFFSSGSVYAIGSDLHGRDKKTYRRFAKAAKKLGEEYYEIMSRSAKLLSAAEQL